VDDERQPEFSCPTPLPARDAVLLGHGSGGRLTAELIREVFLPAFQNPVLARLDDQAIVSVNGLRLAFTTDSFVVSPLFFPGGDIGSLAVNGTVNDLAMGGAQPLFLSAAFIIEEGLPMETLRRVVDSLRGAAAAAGAEVVTGDTKVVEKGSGDGLLLSGSIGEHGIAILAVREGLEFESRVESDSAPLHTLVAAMLAVARDSIRCLRDPTRGGVSSALNEIAAQSRVGIVIDEPSIRVREEVKGACELLGFDPLYVANEGKLVAIVAPDVAEQILAAMRVHPLGQGAEIIGTVRESNPGVVVMRTLLGTTRIVDMLSGDQLPRIC
jgi:hydrogenase expression/formation protein HypE